MKQVLRKISGFLTTVLLISLVVITLVSVTLKIRSLFEAPEWSYEALDRWATNEPQTYHHLVKQAFEDGVVTTAEYDAILEIRLESIRREHLAEREALLSKYRDK